MAGHDVFIQLGTGWAPAAGVLGDGPRIELDGVPARRLDGPHGVLLVALERRHLYQGHEPAAVVGAVRAAAAAGCDVAVLTNAAGVLRADWPVGGTALIRDHINVTGRSPLAGTGRFVDLSDLYSSRLRSVARAVEPALPEGVYVGTHGPEFETPAEIEAYRKMGADLVGMSTVLEAIAARDAGMEVLGLSLITNLAAGMTERLDAAHVYDVAERSGPAAADLLGRIVGALAS